MSHCIIDSLSKVLEIPYSEIIKDIGHDGNEEIWSGIKRGFHYQEIIDFCYRRNIIILHIIKNCLGAPTSNHKPIVFIDDEKRFNNYIKNKKCILIGTTKSGLRHAEVNGTIDSLINNCEEALIPFFDLIPKKL